jgi:meromycolic acid enoyl-[acyl-carrier-protein] reductase
MLASMQADLGSRELSDPAPADPAAPMSSWPALLQGRRLVVTGVATRASIAFAAAELAQRLGAEVVLTSFGRMRRITERAARQLPEPADTLELDVNRPRDFERLREELRGRWGRVDGVVHAVAFAPADAIGTDFLATPPESAELAFRTSAYSLQALAACVAPLMSDGASIVGLDFDASRAWAGYNWMGVAKAALEAVARYLALDLGPRGIRVNLVSAGPLKTVAAGGIPAFARLADLWATHAPLGWDSGAPDVVAGTICFLLSDLARGMTGEILHVDGGLHAVGASASASA